MKITTASHVDHNLGAAHLAHIIALFGEKKEFFIATITLPDTLGEVPCGLHGPSVGDSPIGGEECEMVIRGDRKGASRLTSRGARPTRTLTVIGGPHEGECIMYTAFGGPLAPKEPWDADEAGRPASKAFWAVHALSK